MSVQIYSVPTISCEHCKHAIEGEVAKLGDVRAVSVDIAAKIVRVEGDASGEAIREAIEEAGYDIAAKLS